MERLQKLWNRIRSRVVNGLLIASLILVTVVLLLPEALADFVNSTSLLVRLLVLGFLYIPVTVPAYRLFQERRGRQVSKAAPKPSAEREASPMKTVAERKAALVQAAPPSQDIETEKPAHNDVENEDEFYSLLKSISNEESKQES